MVKIPSPRTSLFAAPPYQDCIDSQICSSRLTSLTISVPYLIHLGYSHTSRIYAPGSRLGLRLLSFTLPYICIGIRASRVLILTSSCVQHSPVNPYISPHSTELKPETVGKNDKYQSNVCCHFRLVYAHLISNFRITRLLRSYLSP